MPQDANHLIWIDMEMTGLKPETDRIIEIAVVVTDSGGIQEETTALGIPCVTVRENTERPVTVELGTNMLAGIRSEGIRRAIQKQLASLPTKRLPELWDGRAAARIVNILTERLISSDPPPVAADLGQIHENAG